MSIFIGGRAVLKRNLPLNIKTRVLLTAVKQVPNVKSEGHGSDVTMKNKKEEWSKWGAFKKDECTVLRGSM